MSSPQASQKKWRWWYAVCPALLVPVFRLPDFFVPFYNIDELTNSLFANLLLDGRLSLESFLGNTYLLTHYFYVLVAYLFGRNNMAAVYACQMFWSMATALVVYLAGKEVTGRRAGGVLASLLFACATVSFMSKDFRAAIAESLSLLPLALSIWLHLRVLRKGSTRDAVLCGYFIGLASLFKAPIGAVIFAVWISIFFRRGRGVFKLFLVSGIGLGLGLTTPLFFYSGFIDGIRAVLHHVDNDQKHYIGYYDELPFLYWGVKYLIRTFLVAVSAPVLWFFAARTWRRVMFNQKGFGARLPVVFLFLTLLCAWLVIPLGKRVFFHYFVFVLPALSLLAAPAFLKFWDSPDFFKNRNRARGVILALLFLPPLGFGLEAVMGWSPTRGNYEATIDYIKANASTSDRIYVWGLIPQIYYFSGRDPATTFFWSDYMAGSSPGSAAMEYMRTHEGDLSYGRTVLLDLKPNTDPQGMSEPILAKNDYDLNESELLSLSEIISRIEDPLWKKLMLEFTARPPVLILDTSPTGVRGFARFPLRKFELLERLIRDNYVYERTLDNIIIYKLKTAAKQDL